MYSLRRRLPLLSLALPLTAALAICCGNAIAAAASASTANASASNLQAARDPLSGTWSGTYSGAYHGTFTLHWKQSGSRLSGTIKLSNPSSKPNISGAVHGTAIRFGTVGSAAITYSGSVSGKSMSGSYKTPGGGGSWSAHKTS
jgi:opacity protein-like surface antigen